MTQSKTQSKLLVTSFQTWLPHQSENASDVLLGAVEQALPETCILLRKLPVDFEEAPRLVVQAMKRNPPTIIVACGMAEGRSQLTVEQFARRDDTILETPLPLTQLIAGLPCTAISTDAGQFVCNSLYFDLLALSVIAAAGKHRTSPWKAAVFVHVPVLTSENRGAIAADFQTFLHRLAAFPVDALSFDSPLHG
ncbi:MAG: peptidase C15 [Cyanobacteria bacterium P01_H01_bin.130]